MAQYSHNRYQAIVTRTTENEKIHRRHGWSAKSLVSDLADAASADILLIPATKPVHLRSFSWVCANAPALVRFYEGVTVVGNGSTIITRNHWRPDATDSDSLSVYSAPNTPGNLVDELSVDLMSGERKAGGSINVAYEEWVLAPGVKYLIRLTNLSGQASAYNVFSAFWYS